MMGDDGHGHKKSCGGDLINDGWRAQMFDHLLPFHAGQSTASMINCFVNFLLNSMQHCKSQSSHDTFECR